MEILLTNLPTPVENEVPNNWILVYPQINPYE
jgi:hypothetical protein